MSSEAFEILVDIERKCRMYAKPLPHQIMKGQVWQGIGFHCADLNFVAPLSEINEVLPVPIMSPLPLQADWFKGIANLRGSVLPITDLQSFVLGSSEKPSAFSRVLVIDFEKTGVGFLVNKVLGVQRFIANSLNTVIEDNIDPKFRPYLQGEFIKDDKHWHILSLSGLSQTTQFYHVVNEMGA